MPFELIARRTAREHIKKPRGQTQSQDVIDESVVGASLLYEAVAQAYLDVGEELVKKGAKSKYNKARVAFKGGGEMSCYELCMTTLIGCPCV